MSGFYLTVTGLSFILGATMTNIKTYCDISFAEKIRIFSNDYLKCCFYIAASDTPEYLFTKKLYSEMIASSQLLEDFLDFHGAKKNTDWIFYRELSAAVRHLSLAGYSQKHISNRLVYYLLPDSEKFMEDGTAMNNFIMNCLSSLAPVIIEEAKRLNIPLPAERFQPADFPGVVSDMLLSADIEGTAKDIQKKAIAKIASKFLEIAKSFDEIGFYTPFSNDEILELVPEKINEVEIRRYEMLVHNLQSSFDTYVLQGGHPFETNKLASFRGFFSVVFHLLQSMGRCLHFYERHLHKKQYHEKLIEVQHRLSDLIDPAALLNHTVNHCLYYTCHFFRTGKSLAEEILNENIERGEIRVGVPVPLGFHMRPSLLVAKIVQNYGGEVAMRINDNRYDASSPLELQIAGGKIARDCITEVRFEGDIRSLKDIEILASANYCEDHEGKRVSFPKELTYLKEM